MAQRITRSKQKIRAANIPYRIPAGQDLPDRLAGVLGVVYLVFNEGYFGSSGEVLRSDLTAEAIRLARQLREMVATRACPGTASGGGRPARTDAAGRVPRARPGCATACSCRWTSRTGPCGTPR